MERFSIRGYTSNMRSSEVLKCWPFDETSTYFIEAFLPPITVHKFKWWADLLDNNEADDDAPLSRMKSKSRVPKKRSIVDIFAVAPQIEKLYNDNDDGVDYASTSTDDDDDDDDDDDVKLSALIRVARNDKRKNKMNLEDRLNKFKRVLVKNNKERGIYYKEKPLKLKTKHPLGSKVHCDGSLHMELAKDFVDVIPVHERKSEPKCYAEGIKTISDVSKLTLEKQKSVLSLRGILKSNSNAVSRKKSITYTMLESSKTNCCCINQANTRDQFSDKGDILGQRRKSIPPIQFPKLLNNFFSYSNTGCASIETDHYAEKGEKCVTMGVNASGRSSTIGKNNAPELQSCTEKQSATTCSCANSLRPHTSQVYLRNAPLNLDQVAYCGKNLDWPEYGYKIAMPDTVSTFPPHLLSTDMELPMPNIMTQGGDNMSMSSSSDVKGLAKSGFGSLHPLAAICSSDRLNPFPQPSSSNFPNDRGNEYGYGRLLVSSETNSENNSGQNLQQYRHLSPKELMHNICSFPVMDQAGVMRLERFTNEDFVELPLNSQGEFIQMHSTGKGGFNQLMRPSSVSDSSRTSALSDKILNNTVGDYPCPKNNQELASSKKPFQFFPVSDHAKVNEKSVVSSLGFSRTQVTGRGDIPFLDYLGGSSRSIYPMKSGIDLMNIHNHDDQIWTHFDDRNMHQGRNSDLVSLNVTQPTMQLMGQKISVGNNCRNLHEDEMVWMDKQMISEHCPAEATINNSLRRHFPRDLIMQPASEKGKKISRPTDIQINLASQSYLEVCPLDTSFLESFRSCQNNGMYENTCRIFSRDLARRSYPYFPPDAFPAFFNKEPIFQDPFFCGYEPQELLASCSHVAFQNLNLNYTQTNTKSPLHYSTNSSFKFPFLRSDLGEHVQPSHHSSYKNLTPWLSNSGQVKETTFGPLQSYPDACGSCHPCTMSGGNLQNIPPICYKTDASSMCNPLFIQSSPQNAPGLVPQQNVRVRHGLLPTLTMNTRREYRMKFKERMRERMCFEDPAHRKRTKKRPAAMSDYSTHPSNVRHVEVSKALSHNAIALNAVGDAGADVLGRKETFGLDSAEGVSKMPMCGQNNTQMDASKLASPKLYPLQLDGVAILPGPVKLTAGSKHILKPSEGTSHESNSGLTHSKIPFSAVTSSGAVSEPRMKSAKVYRF